MAMSRKFSLKKNTGKTKQINEKGETMSEVRRHSSRTSSKSNTASRELGQGINVCIEYIDNIVAYTFPFVAQCKVEYKGELIGESRPILFDSVRVDVNFSTAINLGEMTIDKMDDLVSTPIIFSVSRDVSSTKSESEITRIRQGKKKLKKSTSTASFLPTQLTTSGSVIGCGNMDILPIILGKPEARECIILESPNKLEGSLMRKQHELPRLIAVATSLNNFFQSLPPLGNIMAFTVESLFNTACPDHFGTGTDDFFCVTAGTVIPKSSLLVPPAERKYDLLKFENGRVAKQYSLDRRKKWATLSHKPGRSNLSKYRLDDSFQVKSPVEGIVMNIDYTKPRIQWNSLRRAWLSKSIQEVVYKYIIKYKCWPLEIYFEKGIVRRTGSLDGKERFIAFLDVRNLLQPGATKIRVAANVWTWSKKGIKYSWDLMSHIIQLTKRQSDHSNVEGQKEVISPNRKKTFFVDKSQKISNKEYGIIPKETTRKENDGKSEEESNAILLHDLNRQPVYIIVEIDLLTPFTKRSTKETLLSKIADLITPRLPPPDNVILSTVAEESFRKTVLAISYLISETFKKYKIQNKRCPVSDWSDSHVLEEEASFFQYLHKTGLYQMVRETLKESLPSYIKGSIGSPLKTEPLDIQEYISSLYTRIVKKLNLIVNEAEIGIGLQPKIDPVNSKDLLYFACEATEQEDYKKAKEYILRRIHSNEHSAQFWNDYGVLALRFHDHTRSNECIKQAISKDSRNKDSLLAYAVRAAVNNNFAEAEMFFEAVTAFHPEAHQIWIAAHLFYLNVGKHESAEIALILGTKYAAENSERHSSESENKPLAWSPLPAEEANPFLSTVIYLLNNNLIQYTELCLSKELLRRREITVDHEYYLAVCDHVRDKFTQSNRHLLIAMEMDRKVSRTWRLLGHNYYRLGDKERATKSYSVAMMLPDSTDDQLMYLRLGTYLLEERNYEEAKDMYLKAVNCRPTPKGWFGLGVAYYKLGDLDTAEHIFAETNMLDNNIPDVWAYLAAINLSFQKQEQFKQCMIEAQRHGEISEELQREIAEVKQYYFCEER